MIKHFIDIADFSRYDLEHILDLSDTIKEGVYDPCLPLLNKHVGLIFEKPSLRTRMSFEVGIKQLGGHVVTLQQDEVGFGKRESVQDIANVLSRYIDLVMIRTFSHEDLKAFSKASSIPVINGLTDTSHPCQIMADMMTIKHHFGHLEGIKMCYLGDGNNVSQSLSEACHILGIQFVLSGPENKGCHPNNYVQDPIAAVKQADVLYTDTWVSMGEESQGKSKEAFHAYQINRSLLKYAKPTAIVMHCLPAHRGEEITDEVMAGSQSKIFDQAENRLHAQKGIMTWLLQKSNK